MMGIACAPEKKMPVLRRYDCIKERDRGDAPRFYGP